MYSNTHHILSDSIEIYIFLIKNLLFIFQFGNTCYSNSVLQALYFCKPFRDKVLEYKAKNKRTKETLLTCLADLFYSIATQKKKVGSIAPKKFIARLRKEKEEFDNYMQQDAHEFLNFLINHINEIILAERQQTNKTKPNNNENGQTNIEPTWVHEIFQVSRFFLNIFSLEC